MPDASLLLLLVAFFVVMWLLVIRPQQRRQRQTASMQGSLEVGDQVMLTSGVYGVLRGLDDESVQLEIADAVVIQVARPAVGQLLTPVDEPADQPQDLPDEDAPTRDDDVSQED